MQSKWIKREVSIGNLLLLLGLFGAIASGVYEAGMIRATLEDGIHAEHDSRVANTASLDQRIDSLRDDVRELRALFFHKTKI